MQSVTDRDAAIKEQMGFANWELTHTEKRAGELLHKTNNAGVAGAIVSRYFLRPKDQDGEAERRGAMAEYLSSRNSVVGAALSGARGGADAGSTITNNVTVHAPGGDPKTVTKAVKAAFNDLGLSTRQSSYGLA